MTAVMISEKENSGLSTMTNEEDFPAMPARQVNGVKSGKHWRKMERNHAASASKEAGKGKHAATMWTQVVKQGSKTDLEAMANAPLSTIVTPASQKQLNRIAPQSAQSTTHGLRKGLGECALDSTLGQPTVKQERRKEAELPKRVLTGADILRAGGIPPRSHGSGRQSKQSAEKLALAQRCASPIASVPGSDLSQPPPVSSKLPEVSNCECTNGYSTSTQPLAGPPSEAPLVLPEHVATSPVIPRPLPLQRCQTENILPRVAASPAKRGGERMSPPREGPPHDMRAHQRRTWKKQATGGDRRELQLVPALPMCTFEHAATFELPSGAALSLLDLAIHSFVERTVTEAALLDGPACELMERVQTEANCLWPGAVVSCFGSRATGLACGSSDVDLVVMGVPGLSEAFAAGCDMLATQMHLLQQLSTRLQSLPAIRSVSINKASVPVIALTFALPGPQLPGVPTELHIDVSLHSGLHTGLPAAQHVRMLHSRLPSLQPLVLVLKELLRRHGLKTAFTGGLTSYALVVLVAQYLIDREKFDFVSREVEEVDPSIGTLLLECLHFLGVVFDPQQHAVFIRRRPQGLEYGFAWREQWPELEDFALHPLLCVDPLQPSNNVGKSCYRISCIQRLFRGSLEAVLAACKDAMPELALPSTALPYEEAGTEALEGASGQLAETQASVLEALFRGQSANTLGRE